MKQNKTHNLHLYEPTKALQGHKAPIYVAKFNKDQQYLLTGSQDRSIILWNPYKELMIQQYTGAHNYEVYDVAISDDNSKFASCGGDKMAFYWDVATAQVLKKFGSHNTRINCLAIGGETSILATGGYDCEVKIWDLKDKKAYQPIQRLKEFSDSVTHIVFEAYNMIISSIDGNIRVYDLRKGTLTSDFVTAGIMSFGKSYDNRLLCLSCNDSKIRILERSSGQILAVLQGAHSSQHYKVDCQFSWNDGMILTGSEDGKLLIYDILTSKQVISRKLHDKCVSCIALSQDAFITASHDNVALLWQEQS